jgi:hypothetical protein
MRFWVSLLSYHFDAEIGWKNRAPEGGTSLSKRLPGHITQSVPNEWENSPRSLYCEWNDGEVPLRSMNVPLQPTRILIWLLCGVGLLSPPARAQSADSAAIRVVGKFPGLVRPNMVPPIANS